MDYRFFSRFSSTLQKLDNSRFFNMPLSILEIGCSWTGLYLMNQTYDGSVPILITGLAFIVNSFLTIDGVTRLAFNTPIYRSDRDYKEMQKLEKEHIDLE